MKFGVAAARDSHSAQPNSTANSNPYRLLLLFGCWPQDTSHPLVVVDCATLSGQLQAQQLLQPGAAAALAASSSSSSSSSPNEASRAVLMAALQKGTLVLQNLHKVCCTT